MFHVLIESAAHPGERRTGWTMASVAAHITLVAAAVALTLRDVGPTQPPDAIEYVLTGRDYVDISRPPEQGHAPQTDGLTTLTAPTIVAPTVVPFDLPPVGHAPFSPSEIVGVELHPAMGPSNGTPTSGVYIDRAVDRAVVPRADNGSPTYPAHLRAAGVEGDVFVRFVVDSTGRIEPATLAIVQATHAAFGDAVKHWLLQSRYLPAEVGGRAVRQLVEQRFGFTLRP